MYQRNYYVDKSTGTFADVEEAYGLAAVLSYVVGSTSKLGAVNVRLYDDGPYYRVELPRPITEQQLESVPFQAFNKYVPVGKKQTPAELANPSYSVDLTQQYEMLRRLGEWRQIERQRKNTATQVPGKGRARRTAELQELNEEQRRLLETWQPDADFPIWDAMQVTKLKAIDTYNGAVRQWHALSEHFAAMLRVMLLRYSATPNLNDESEEAWKKLVKERSLSGEAAELEASAVQMFNPAMGKGANKDKPSGVGRSGRTNFWLAEYLKHQGMYQAGITLTVDSDRKIYVICPRKVVLNQHAAIFMRFRNALRGEFRYLDHAYKADILAALGYSDAFLAYIAEELPSDTTDPYMLTPTNAVAGMQTALYKSMGKADAVMNLSFINLPGWVQPRRTSEVQAYRETLREHSLVIRQMGHDKAGKFIGRGDVLDLLREYRDFLSANDLQPFFRFAVGYSAYLTHAIQNEWRYATFTTKNLERMVTMSKPEFEKIVTSAGFLRIADAIRRSTIGLQREKARGQTPKFDIRYGLGTELSRAAANDSKPEMFIQALSEFIFKYNSETAQTQETSKNIVRRPTVRVSDLDEIVNLVRDFGAHTVCSLLIAYGYASTGGEKPTSDEPETQMESDSDEQ